MKKSNTLQQHQIDSSLLTDKSAHGITTSFEHQKKQDSFLLTEDNMKVGNEDSFLMNTSTSHINKMTQLKEYGQDAAEIGLGDHSKHTI
jgi:hypothetical protein